MKETINQRTKSKKRDWKRIELKKENFEGKFEFHWFFWFFVFFFFFLFGFVLFELESRNMRIKKIWNLKKKESEEIESLTSRRKSKELNFPKMEGGMEVIKQKKK